MQLDCNLLLLVALSFPYLLPSPWWLWCASQMDYTPAARPYVDILGLELDLTGPVVSLANLSVSVLCLPCYDLLMSLGLCACSFSRGLAPEYLLARRHVLLGLSLLRCILSP